MTAPPPTITRPIVTPLRKRRSLALFVTPAVVAVIVIGVVLWINAQDFTAPGRAPEGRALDFGDLLSQFGQHAYLVGVSTVVVVIISIPLGILLSRKSAGRLGDAVLSIGGFLQALPPFGVIILMAFSPLGFGAGSAIVALVIASFLPVLTNTVVGLRAVEPSYIEAARGMGMSAGMTLRLVELPLAVPVMVAGIRVALVLNVGTATLATYIGAGGLGTPILSMLKLGRADAAFAVAALVTALALFVDWLAAVVERLVRGSSA
ncbi:MULTISPECIES: ABC transporter permease [unclassified Pseudonocardia]|jgi:osmoprotectant transport system permease protein|uniref:ABC transporter permease n=1 Tax=unclassified Pseudonocardia TaxID=2619320 RepID=UPI001AC31F38|nr:MULTISPECIES: ABC transporter permease [unclassified Pseudonocardia]MBN9102551.1 ABC transporter permease [Pseudonocardia sp.]